MDTAFNPFPGVEALVSQADAGSIYHRLGELTRQLHDALQEMSYGPRIEQVVSRLPEARSRLSYIARLTGEAAEKVLNAVDQAKAEQEAIAEAAARLAGDLREDPVAAVATGAVGGFVDLIAERCGRTREHLTDIMMAQDFHDLTGQVTRKLVETAERMESSLLELLVDATPDESRPLPAEHGPQGPVLDGAQRTDVVANQQQVDDLLESLGF